MKTFFVLLPLLLSSAVFSFDTQFGISNEVSEQSSFRERRNLLAAGIYNARSRNPKLCPQSVRPVFAGENFLGYDVTTLGTCSRQTARFTCRLNYCETTANPGLFMSVISTISYVFTNQNEPLSDVFEI